VSTRLGCLNAQNRLKAGHQTNFFALSATAPGHTRFKLLA
jgi:hypothetical protein